MLTTYFKGFPGGSEVKASACNAGDLGSIPGSGRSPGEGNGNPLPVFLPGGSHGQRSLVGYSPQGRKESDTTERLHLHLHLHLPSTWIKQGIYFLSSLSRKKIDSSQVISVLVSIPLPAFCWATGRIFRFLRQGFREWKLWGKPTFQRASSFEKCWSPRRKSWTPKFI